MGWYCRNMAAPSVTLYHGEGSKEQGEREMFTKQEIWGIVLIKRCLLYLQPPPYMWRKWGIEKYRNSLRWWSGAESVSSLLPAFTHFIPLTWNSFYILHYDFQGQSLGIFFTVSEILQALKVVSQFITPTGSCYIDLLSRSFVGYSLWLYLLSQL